jgi:capsular polysaccharide biosynthesis protein
MGAIVGLLLFGGAYYLKNIFGKPERFEITTVYYVEYDIDPRDGVTYTYINGYTWDNWVDSDEFIDSVREKALLPETVTKEQIQGYQSANLETDLRILYVKVKTEDANLTISLNKALQETFFEFAKRQRELRDIRIVDTEGPRPAEMDNRIIRALVLGGVLGFFCTLAVMGAQFILDDSIRIPQTFTYRYGIPMLGSAFLSGEVLEHFKYVFRGKKRIAVTATDPDGDIQGTAQALGQLMEQITEGGSCVGVPWVMREPEGATALRGADGILLLVKAGASNGKRIEKVLDFLKIEGCAVDGALLWGEDRRLIETYFLPGTFWQRR